MAGLGGGGDGCIGGSTMVHDSAVLAPGVLAIVNMVSNSCWSPPQRAIHCFRYGTDWVDDWYSGKVMGPAGEICLVPNFQVPL